MSVINRTLDASQQRQALSFSLGNAALTPGETGVIAYIPFPCVLQGGNICTKTVAGSPNLLFTLERFIPGTGYTTWALGSTFVPVDFGTSGVLPTGVSLRSNGNTLLNLMANDVIQYLVGGSGGGSNAIYGFCGAFVLRPPQDVRVFLGII